MRPARGLVIGIGCRRGVAADAIAAAVDKARGRIAHDAEWEGVDAHALASIDAKADEPGLLAYARRQDLPLHLFSAEVLATFGSRSAAPAPPGPDPSLPLHDTLAAAAAPDASAALSTGAVRRRFGIDNVCEAAALAVCPVSEVLLAKTVFGDITIAIVGVRER